MGSWSFLSDEDGSIFMVLLTDGSVLCHSTETLQLKRLRPDEHSDYSRGAWTIVTDALTAGSFGDPLVLADGRVFVNSFSRPQIFDPVANLWQTLTPDARLGVGSTTQISSPLCVLRDGQILVALRRSAGTGAAALYDPRRDTWTPVTDPLGIALHNRGVLLANGTVVATYEGLDGRLGFQMYWPERNEWKEAGAGNVRALGTLLPDGRVLVVTDRLMFFHPPATFGPLGELRPGPELPRSDSRGWQLWSTPSIHCLLPSGRVLCSAQYIEAVSAGRRGTRWARVFYEFDTVTSTLHPQDNARFVYTSSEAHGLDFSNISPTLLPTGQVLVNVWGRDINVFAIYTPDELPINDGWRPVINDCTFNRMGSDHVYEITGLRFNGMSQAVAGSATNYPIVQLKSRYSRPGRRWYCRTFGHSSMGVATGGAPVVTHLALPPGAPLGSVEIRVVANGIASAWCNTFIDDPYTLRDPLIPLFWNQLIGNLADGPLLVIGPDGRLWPVPPWDPSIKEVMAAYVQLREGVEKLKKLSSLISSTQEELARLQSFQKGPGKQLDTPDKFDPYAGPGKKKI